MSKLFGPVVQQGYVVSDIDEGMQHWIARGVGPCYLEKHISPPCELNIHATMAGRFGVLVSRHMAQFRLRQSNLMLTRHGRN